MNDIDEIRKITDYVFNTDMMVGEPYVKLREMIEELLASQVAAARIDLLEELDRQAEVIGVGYPIVRAEYIRNLLVELKEGRE